MASIVPSALFWNVAKKPPKKLPRINKITDETVMLKRPRKGGRLNEEVWVGQDGKVVRYNLAYINHRICGVDNGRVLGYDNSHGYHHRHFMGTVEAIEYRGYAELNERFHSEVKELWRRER